MGQIDKIVSKVVETGSPVISEIWQGVEERTDMVELLHQRFDIDMYRTSAEAAEDFKPKLPWANEHFHERVSGQPLNPPPSHTMWSGSTEEYYEDGNKFSHSYPERLWSKGLHSGIRYDIADLDTLVAVLSKDLGTRQAYLPMFFPEDLSASLAGDRVPCSLGWQFIVRDGVMDCFYPIRSCDVFRHLRNDIYLANMLVMWVIERLEMPHIVPGKLIFHATSLHCFEQDITLYKKGLIK